MAHIFELVNQLFAQVVPVADFLWDFPTNIDAYANIPILGQLSIAFLLLLGGSLYFTLRFGFVQVKEFKTGIRLLTSKQQAKVGTSQLAAFLVSMGGRVGAGNIVGVTGAVTLEDQERSSGCGFPHSWGWRHPSVKQHWHRFLKREKEMNM